MEKLKTQLEALPPKKINGRQYISYQAVTDTVAAFLFPNSPANQMAVDDYQRILETADTLCRQLGYREVVKLTPPDVTLSDMGLYWAAEPESQPPLETQAEPIVIHMVQ